MRLAMGQLYARSIASPIEAHHDLLTKCPGRRPSERRPSSYAQRSAFVLSPALTCRSLDPSAVHRRSARTRNARWSPLPLLPGVREALDSGTAVRDSHAVHDNDVISPMTTPSPPPPLLEARAVQKHFGRVVALREANFTLRPDEVHAIVGDNGAGKSTLIKIISGVYHADAGEIAIDGRPVTIEIGR